MTTPARTRLQRRIDYVRVRLGGRYVRRDEAVTGRAARIPGAQIWPWLIDGIEYDDDGVARPGGLRREATDLVSEYRPARTSRPRAMKQREMIGAWEFAAKLEGEDAIVAAHTSRREAREATALLRRVYKARVSIGPIIRVFLPAPPTNTATRRPK